MKKILYWCGAIATIAAVVVPTWIAFGWELPPWPSHDDLKKVQLDIEEVGARTRELQSGDYQRQQQYLDDRREEWDAKGKKPPRYIIDRQKRLDIKRCQWHNKVNPRQRKICK